MDESNHVSVKNSGRRRGALLEDSILAAAWDELLECGYVDLTTEAVAKRAGTSRTVLHRRWQGRAELVAAAIRHHAATNPIEVPDLGSMRAELVVFLRKLSERGAPTLAVLFLQGAYFSESGPSFEELRAGITEPATQAIFQRAVSRGEVDPDRLTPRLVSLPVDLVRHEVMMTLQPVPIPTIEAILDEVFFPLVRPANGAPSCTST